MLCHEARVLIPCNHLGYSRRQGGPTLLELQGLMATEEENTNCDHDDVIMEKTQVSDTIDLKDGSKATHVDGECTALTDQKDKEFKSTFINAIVPRPSHISNLDSCSNECTEDSISDDGSFIINELSDFEMEFQGEQEHRILKTKDGVHEENSCQNRDQVLYLSDAQVFSSLQKPQSSCLDIHNTSADTHTTDQSFSTDLSDCIERTQESHERDVDEEDTCRICHCGSETEPLISPCCCTGTVKHIHHSCLMDWLKRCVKTKCELCLQNFSVHRKTKPLNKWRRPDQKPTPIIWLLTFIVALTLNIASIAKDGSQKCVSNPCIIFYVVGALGAMLGFAFFYHWLIVSIRYVKQWMALNEEWTLVGSNTKILGNENLGASNKSIETKVQRNQVEVV